MKTTNMSKFLSVVCLSIVAMPSLAAEMTQAEHDAALRAILCPDCANTPIVVTPTLTQEELVAIDPRWGYKTPVPAPTVSAPLTQEELVALDPRWGYNNTGNATPYSNVMTPVDREAALRAILCPDCANTPIVVTTPLTQEELVALDPRWGYKTPVPAPSAPTPTASGTCFSPCVPGDVITSAPSQLTPERIAHDAALKEILLPSSPVASRVVSPVAPVVSNGGVDGFNPISESGTCFSPCIPPSTKFSPYVQQPFSATPPTFYRR